MSSRDPNLDHPAVQLYREICRLTPNVVQRREIVVTVDWGKGILGSPKRALEHWEGTLKKFMLEGRPPQRVDWAMDRYEERVRKASGQQ
jgi:hypothetical protein